MKELRKTMVKNTKSLKVGLGGIVRFTNVVSPRRPIIDRFFCNLRKITVLVSGAQKTLINVAATELM
jgi:hypothetical protein